MGPLRTSDVLFVSIETPIKENRLLETAGCAIKKVSKKIAASPPPMVVLFNCQFTLLFYHASSISTIKKLDTEKRRCVQLA